MVKIENKDLKLEDIPINSKDPKLFEFAKSILKNDFWDPIILSQKARNINKNLEEMNLTKLRIMLFFYGREARWFSKEIVENAVSEILPRIRKKVARKEFD